MCNVFSPTKHCNLDLFLLLYWDDIFLVGTVYSLVVCHLLWQLGGQSSLKGQEVTWNWTVSLRILADYFLVLVTKVVNTTKGSFLSVDKVVLVFECGILNSNFERTLVYNHCKVENINTSWLEAHFRFYRLLMKAKTDVYLQWPFKEKSSFLISITC